MNSEKRFDTLEGIIERLEKLTNENRNFLKFIAGAIFCGSLPLAFGESLKMAAQWAIAGGVVLTLMYKSAYDWTMKFRRMREEEKFFKDDKPKDEQK